jgi:chemotaxis protein CheD
MQYTVGIGECVVTCDATGTIVTHALGSCIAILVHDPVAKVGGMLHYMLPDSASDPDKGLNRPYLFADTGIPLLFNAAYQAGAQKRRIVVSAVGGAQILKESDTFNIGKRNELAMRKILWRAGVILNQEEVGGVIPRTVRLDIGTGRVSISSGREFRQLDEQKMLKGRANGL